MSDPTSTPRTRGRTIVPKLARLAPRLPPGDVMVYAGGTNARVVPRRASGSLKEPIGWNQAIGITLVAAEAFSIFSGR